MLHQLSIYKLTKLFDDLFKKNYVKASDFVTTYLSDSAILPWSNMLWTHTKSIEGARPRAPFLTCPPPIKKEGWAEFSKRKGQLSFCLKIMAAKSLFRLQNHLGAFKQKRNKPVGPFSPGLLHGFAGGGWRVSLQSPINEIYKLYKM